MDDRDAQRLSRRMLGFQESFDFDFIKVMLERHGPLPDWGARVRYHDPDPNALGEMTEPLVRTLDDWRKFVPLDIRRGSLARDIETLRLIVRGAKDVPVIQTVFSPFTLALKAAGQTLYDHLRRDPTPVQEALRSVTAVLEGFVTASLEAGAGGIFLAFQGAHRNRLSSIEYEEWARPHDLRVLGAARQRSVLNILHLHGRNVMFEQLARYPGDALNWEPGDGNPTIDEATRLTNKALIVGVHHERVAAGSRQAAADGVRDAIRATRGRRIIVGPSCTIEPSTDPSILSAIAREAKELRSDGGYS